MKKPFYAPILRAKPGEFTAVGHLAQKTKSRLFPLFDIPRNTSKAKIPKTDIEHLNGVVEQIEKVWAGRPLMVDVTSWNPSSLTSEGEHVINYLHTTMEQAGLQVFPVVGYDRWDDPTYQNALSNIQLASGRSFVVRLDEEAIEDSLDPDYFEGRLEDILSSLACDASECVALLDFGDLCHKPLAEVIDKLPGVLKILKELKFSRMIFAGSSVPGSINLAVKYAATEGLLLRKEMLIWQALYQAFPKLVFGDYGVRSPRSNEDVIAPDTNGKIRYTTDKQFYIARGYSLRTKEKGAQHHGLAQKIIDSQYFMNSDFSWGDAQLVKCAAGDFSGNSTTWIGIDTNHHIEMVVREIREHVVSPETVDQEVF